MILPPGGTCVGQEPLLACGAQRSGCFPESHAGQHPPPVPQRLNPTRSGEVGNPSLKHKDKGVLGRQIRQLVSGDEGGFLLCGASACCPGSWMPVHHEHALCRAGHPLSAQSRGPGAALLRGLGVSSEPSASKLRVQCAAALTFLEISLCSAFSLCQPYKYLLLYRKYSVVTFTAILVKLQFQVEVFIRMY